MMKTMFQVIRSCDKPRIQSESFDYWNMLPTRMHRISECPRSRLPRRRQKGLNSGRDYTVRVGIDPRQEHEVPEYGYIEPIAILSSEYI
jgi:hypothetical protein